MRCPPSVFSRRKKNPSTISRSRSLASWRPVLGVAPMCPRGSRGVHPDREGHGGLSRGPLARSLEPSAFEALLKRPMRAAENAKPAAGRFPLIAIGQGLDFLVTSEDDRARVNSSEIHIDFMIGGDNVAVTGLTRDGRELALLRDGSWQPAVR